MQALDTQKTFKHSSKPLREVSKDKGTEALSYLKRFNAQQQKTCPLPGSLRLQASVPLRAHTFPAAKKAGLLHTPLWGPGWLHSGIWSQTPTLTLPFACPHGRYQEVQENSPVLEEQAQWGKTM